MVPSTALAVPGIVAASAFSGDASETVPLHP